MGGATEAPLAGGAEVLDDQGLKTSANLIPLT